MRYTGRGTREQDGPLQMKMSAELQLRKIALGLTALVLLQLVWGGARLLLESDLEPILPAESSLQVDDIRYGAGLSEELSQDIVSRPVFWQGRQAYTPPAASGDVGRTGETAAQFGDRRGCLAGRLCRRG